MTSKRDLRIRFRAGRQAMTRDDYLRRSRLITDRVSALPEFARAQSVHSYWPAVEQREVDTRPLIEHLAARGTRVILPKVHRFEKNPTGQRLVHVQYEPHMPLQPNRWGIPEPVNAPTVDLTAVDLILVPALGCDVRGNRLGHGYGYYDEFLSSVGGTRLCLCMDEFVIDELPAAAHDQTMDVIVTQTRLIRTGSR